MVAFVTGASGGTGAALVKAFVSGGGRASSPSHAGAGARDIIGPSRVMVIADVRDPDARRVPRSAEVSAASGQRRRLQSPIAGNSASPRPSSCDRMSVARVRARSGRDQPPRLDLDGARSAKSPARATGPQRGRARGQSLGVHRLRPRAASGSRDTVNTAATSWRRARRLPDPHPPRTRSPAIGPARRG